MKNKAPFVGNLTWKALQYTGSYLDDQERELIMSLVGTIIYYPEESARPRADRAHAHLDQPVALRPERSERHGCHPAHAEVQRLHQLRRGDAEHRLYPHALHRQGRDDDALHRGEDRHAHRHPQQLDRGRLQNQTTEPVYKMLSIGTSIPGPDCPTA